MARGEWIGGSAAAGGATRRIGGATPPSAIAATSSGMPTGLPLVDAADDAEVQRLLESGCRVGQTGANGNNALHYFASKGHLDTRLKLALDHAEANEPDALNAPNGSDQTPFFIACQSNRPGAVRLLLDCQGVDVTVLGNIGTSYRRSTGTPLVAALQNSGKIDDEQWRPREVVAALVSAARDTSREPSRRPSLDLPAELSNQLPDWARTLLGGSTSNPKARTPTKKATATRQVPTKKKSTATGEPGRAAPETDSEDSDNEGDPAEVPMPQAPGAGNPLSFRFMTWNVNGSRSHGVADPDDYRAHSLELLVRGPNPPDLLLVQELKKGLKIAPQAGPILDIAGYDLKSVEESSPNAQGVRRLTGRVNGIFNREGLGLDPVRHHRLDAFVLHLMQERDVQLRNLAGAWAALGPLWNDLQDLGRWVCAAVVPRGDDNLCVVGSFHFIMAHHGSNNRDSGVINYAKLILLLGELLLRMFRVPVIFGGDFNIPATTLEQAKTELVGNNYGHGTPLVISFRTHVPSQPYRRTGRQAIDFFVTFGWEPVLGQTVMFADVNPRVQCIRHVPEGPELLSVLDHDPVALELGFRRVG